MLHLLAFLPYSGITLNFLKYSFYSWLFYWTNSSCVIDRFLSDKSHCLTSLLLVAWSLWESSDIMHPRYWEAVCSQPNWAFSTLSTVFLPPVSTLYSRFWPLHFESSISQREVGTWPANLSILSSLYFWVIQACNRRSSLTHGSYHTFHLKHGTCCLHHYSNSWTCSHFSTVFIGLRL
jgi:hypothetical protein